MSSLKKIAIITGSLETGGAESMIAQLAINIDKTNYIVKVICVRRPSNDHLSKQLKDHGIDVIYLSNVEGIDYRCFYRLYAILNKFKPDVVHTHLSGAVYVYPWIVLHRSKMVHTLHTLPQYEFSRLTQKALKFLYQLGKAVMVTVSPFNQKNAIAYHGLDEKRIRMIFNPVDTRKFYKHKENSGKFVFINVGRQDANKNQQLIVRAIKEIVHDNQNIELHLVGDGNQHGNLKNLVRELGLEEYVKFYGIVNDVENYLSKADVYIQSSHYEGLPLSILEAMAANLPIIATNVGGVSDIVTDNGILIEDDDLDGLIASMKLLMKDQRLCAEMSEKSYINVQRLDSRIVAGKYCELYEELIEKQRCRK